MGLKATKKIIMGIETTKLGFCKSFSNKCVLVVCCFIFIIGCTSKTPEDLNISLSTKKDALKEGRLKPYNLILKGPTPFMKAASRELKLDEIYSGYDSMQVRLWYSAGIKPYSRLVIIKINRKLILENYLYSYNSTLKTSKFKVNLVSKKTLSYIDSLMLTRKMKVYGINKYPKEYAYGYQQPMDGESWLVHVEIAKSKNYSCWSYRAFNQYYYKYKHLNDLKLFLDYLDSKVGFYDLDKTVE